jgi:hypothetical protein
MKPFIVLFLMSLSCMFSGSYAQDSVTNQIMSEFTEPVVTASMPKQESSAVENLQALIIKLRNDQIMIDKRYGFWAISIVSSLLVVTLITSLFFFKGRKARIDDIIHLIGLITIVYGTIILVLVSKTDQQITAAIGILGAIAGYLFGSIKKSRDENEPEPNKTSRPAEKP